jgi:hypothetical protein
MSDYPSMRVKLTGHNGTVEVEVDRIVASHETDLVNRKYSKTFPYFKEVLDGAVEAYTKLDLEKIK